MSYYTVVREEGSAIIPVPDEEEEEEEDVMMYYLSTLFQQDAQWPIIGVFIYIFVFTIAFTLFARSKDNMDLMQIRATEEGEEDIPDAQVIDKKSMSLNAWIFNRRLMI
jgi:hypothetical protein